MDPFFSFLLTLEFKIFDPFVASPFHLFHFNIPLNSIWILFKYIWRIIVFLFQQLFSSHSQSSSQFITKLLPSFFLRSYPPHFSSLLRGQLRFWFFNARERLKVQSGKALVINDPVLEWQTRTFLSTYSFSRDVVCSEI